MPGIYWVGRVQVADYAASIRGGKATLAIKLTVEDNRDLTDMIDQIESIRAGSNKKKRLMIADQRD